MSISKTHGKKSPSQNPASFYKSEQQGGARGTPSSVPEKLTGGPMNEKVMGKKSLGDNK